MRTWRWRLPTRWQITILYATVMTVVLAGVGTATLHQQRAFLTHDTTNRLARDAHRQIDGFLSNGLSEKGLVDGSEFSSFAAVLPDELETPDTGALLLDPQGNPFANGHKGPVAPIPPDDKIAEAARTKTDVSFQTTVDGSPVVAVLIPFAKGDQVMGFAEMSTSLAPVNDALDRLRLYFVVGWIAAVGLTTVVGLRATRQVLWPLEHLVGTTRRIAAGDLSQRVNLPPGSNEVAQLGASFDAMVAQLESTFEAQRRFIADAAHELRTPLTAMSASTELLLIGADEADSAKTHRLLRHLDSELNRLIRLANDLLTLSALEAHAPMTLAPTDLSALAHDVGEQSRQLLAGQDLTVEAAAGLWINANPDRMRQVLLNLLDNARKHTPKGGRITLSASAEGNEIRVIVSDTGRGIPRDALPHLFRRFYRVDFARSRQTGGVGLGLSIAHGVIVAHGGRIAVESAPNAGTQVLISLPALDS
jgi:two-component system OmpR family sensor kinase